MCVFVLLMLLIDIIRRTTTIYDEYIHSLLLYYLPTYVFLLPYPLSLFSFLVIFFYTPQFFTFKILLLL